MAAEIDQALSNAIASGVSAPVDILTWLLRKGGLPIEKPVLGSDWMREKGLTKDVKPGAAQVVGETVGNLVDPLSAAAKTAVLIPAIGKYAHISDAATALRKSKPDLTSSELWDKLKAFRYPGQVALSDAPAFGAGQAKWGTELPNGIINKSKLGNGKTYQLDDVFDNEALFDAIPELRYTLLQTGLPTGVMARNAQGVYAHHESPFGSIYINPTASQNHEGTFRHELSHAINAHTKQLGSIGNVSRHDASTIKDKAYDMADIVEQIAPDNMDATYLAKLLRDTGRVGASGADWRYSAGERLAEADAYRSALPEAARGSPSFDMNKGLYPRSNPKVLIPDNLSLELERSLLLHDNDPKEALSYLLRKLK